MAYKKKVVKEKVVKENVDHVKEWNKDQSTQRNPSKKRYFRAENVKKAQKLGWVGIENRSKRHQDLVLMELK